MRVVNQLQERKMHGGKQRGSPHGEVKVGEIVIELVTKLSCLGSFLSEDVNYDRGIRRPIGVAECIFVKLGKIIRSRKI